MVHTVHGNIVMGPCGISSLSAGCSVHIRCEGDVPYMHVFRFRVLMSHPFYELLTVIEEADR